MSLLDGERVCVTSRRGQVEAPIRIDPSLRPGLAFMTLHFQDDVATNLLTIDATDPKSGTAEFKATAIRIEKLEEAVDHVREKGSEVYGPLYFDWMEALSYYFYDPDGNLLEFWSPDPAPAASRRGENYES